MKTLVFGAVGLLGFLATDAFAQSTPAGNASCQFFEGIPFAGFSGAMEGGPGTTVPGPDPNASVTTSGYTRGVQNGKCSASVGLLEVGKSEPGGRRSRARIQNSDGPPGGS